MNKTNLINKIIRNTKDKFQEKITKLGKKRIYINIAILFIVVFVCLLIDQLSKNLVFSDADYNDKFSVINKVYNWGFIGFRPLLHHGVTTKIDNLIGFTGIHIFAFALTIFLLIFIPFSKHYAYAFFLSILLAGNWGNELDRFINDNSVKDLIFIPYRDNGTFNFADVFIFLGPSGFALVYFIDYILEKYKNSNNKKNANNPDQMDASNLENFESDKE